MYYSKPSYQTLKAALESMKTHVNSSAIKSFSIPKISCGLDGLKWSVVKRIIVDVFHSMPLTVTVYTQ